MVFSQTLKSWRSARITKAEKDFVKKLDFKDIKFPKLVTFTKLKKRIPLTLVFLVMKMKKRSNLCIRKTV